jgi:hypothetical protein
MQKLPLLEKALHLAFDARTDGAPCGVSLTSYFARGPTRGRKQQGAEEELIFPAELRARLGEHAGPSIASSLDATRFRSCAKPTAAVPRGDREWLAHAATALGAAETPQLAWALLGAADELERAALKLLGGAAKRQAARRALHGVRARTLHTEPFAALLLRVLLVAQSVYAACRLAGLPHREAWAALEDRLWSAYPTGRSAASGHAPRGAYLPSLVLSASAHGRRRSDLSVQQSRTQDHAAALLARFSRGPGGALWPWIDEGGKLVPQGDSAPEPQAAAAFFFVLLTFTASSRRLNGGPARKLPAPFEEAGFGASDWLPDRTDDLALRLLAAAGLAPDAALVASLPLLLRATLTPSIAKRQPKARVWPLAMLERAQARLPLALSWLEENGRELLERA